MQGQRLVCISCVDGRVKIRCRLVYEIFSLLPIMAVPPTHHVLQTTQDGLLSFGRPVAVSVRHVQSAAESGADRRGPVVQEGDF